ncbi:MAG: RNA methyltransferase [Lactobacillales bacterium]|jgi:TrmH family RNA methyltransferase|nr:RNA methyltransferase [Lactobacillales bacterium]
MVKEIISIKNEQLKKWKKLQTKKGRLASQQYLIEGFHLVEEAFKTHQQIEAVLYTKHGKEKWNSFLHPFEKSQKVLVSDEVMKKISTLPNPQGIAAVLNLKTDSQLPLNLSGSWLLLDQVQDPGNVGTMIRSAAALGWTGIILGEGSADLYQSKVLRAMQGSHFYMKIFQGDLQDWIPQLKKQGFKIYGTDINKNATPIFEVEKTSNLAIILGNEGSGVNANLLKMTDKNIYIPLSAHTESLNVSIAAGILMHHFKLS